MWPTDGADASLLASDCVEGWVRSALGPCDVDEDALQRGTRELYASLGLPAPTCILILDSPLQCAAFEQVMAPHLRGPRLRLPAASWTLRREMRRTARPMRRPSESATQTEDRGPLSASELETFVVEMEALEVRSPHRQIAPLLASRDRWLDALAQVEQRVSRHTTDPVEYWFLEHARALIARERRERQVVEPPAVEVGSSRQQWHQLWVLRSQGREEARRHAKRVPGRVRIRHVARPTLREADEEHDSQRTVHCWMEGPGMLTHLDRLARSELLLRLGRPAERFAPVLAALGRAGLWTSRLRRSLAVLCTRPARIHLDANRRVHKASGPAIEWRDGFPDHRLHGVTLPEDVFRNLDRLDARDVLQMDNAERRRVLLERLGRERLLASIAPEVVDEDVDRACQPRRLLRVETRQEPMVLVEVRCPSTGHVHYLQVPPDITTCEMAVAWTFGLTPATYAPLVEA